MDLQTIRTQGQFVLEAIDQIERINQLIIEKIPGVLCFEKHLYRLGWSNPIIPSAKFNQSSLTKNFFNEDAYL